MPYLLRHLSSLKYSPTAILPLPKTGIKRKEVLFWYLAPPMTRFALLIFPLISEAFVQLLLLHPMQNQTSQEKHEIKMTLKYTLTAKRHM